MPDKSQDNSTAGTNASASRGAFRDWITIRTGTPLLQRVLLGICFVAICFGVWWFVTRGPSETRMVTPLVLPSPTETFARDKIDGLWNDQALARNVIATLRRVIIGFTLAVVIGVPLGVLAGCFTRIEAFFAPLIVFGRNIPLAALIPMMFVLFGIDEFGKVMFILSACIAFVIADTTQAIKDVDSRFIDTAYTLGAKPRHVILKVIVPLALPSVCNSLRLMFGLAFGYIMLGETIKSGGEYGGIGHLINDFFKRSLLEYIYLIVLVIPVLALTLDRLLFWVQRQLFPHEYGGAGILNSAVRTTIHMWEKLKGLIWKPPDLSQIALATPDLDQADPSNTALDSEAEQETAADKVVLTDDALPNVVEFHDVTKTYGVGQSNEFTAIKDVEFHVKDIPKQGEFVCILGPSGCGKSTILRLIAGLTPQHPPTTGSVLVQGKPVTHPGSDRGMVFQDYTSFDHRTVLENVAFGLECQGVPRDVRYDLSRQWIEKVGLNVETDQYKYPHELSGGMRQRVAIARTLILHPRIILMDEPFGALDPHTRMNMQDLLIKLWRSVQSTVFFVTHSIEEAVYLGDRVYILSNSPGTLMKVFEVTPPDRPAREMQKEQEFQETVYEIRDLITQLEEE